jgi:hypothetical protein
MVKRYCEECLESNFILRLISMPIITEEYGIIGAVAVLFIFGCMFLLSGLYSAVSGLIGNLLLLIAGILFLMLALFLFRKYWSVFRRAIGY